MNPVLALGLTQIVGYGSLYYAFPILAPSVAETFGRPEAHLYAVFSVGLLIGGLGAPIAPKYTALCCRSASRTSADRLPLPIVAFSPSARRRGV